MAQSAYVIEDKKIVLFWSRKAGNTSLADWLLDVYSEEDAGEGTPRRVLEAMVPIVEPEQALALVRNEGYTDYVLTRNPFGRIVSSFVEKFMFYNTRRGQLRVLDDLYRLKGYAQSAYLSMRHAKGLPSSRADYRESFPGLTFVDLLEYVRDEVKAKKRHGEPDLNGHLGPQVPALFEREGFEYANVIHLEQAARESEPLAKALGTDRPFPHARRNANPGLTTVGDRDLSRVSTVEMIGERIVPAASALLTPETIGLIREAFEPDFRKLHYSVDPPAVKAQ